MTDNELTAAIGRELMGWKIDETPAATWKFWLVAPGSTTHTKQAWSEKPKDEDVGELLLRKGFAYSTDPQWIGQIIIAAAGKGIMVTVESFYRDREDAIGWLVKARDVGKPCDGLYHVDSADLPRTLCRAIMAAAGEEVPGE